MAEEDIPVGGNIVDVVPQNLSRRAHHGVQAKYVSAEETGIEAINHKISNEAAQCRRSSFHSATS